MPKKKKHKRPRKKHREEESAPLSPEQASLMQEGLEAIFGEEEIDFTKLDRGPSRLTQFLLAAVIILTLISASAWGGYFLYTRYAVQQTEATFEIEIDTESEVVSGEIIDIDIRYFNPTNAPIASLEMEVRLPEGFELLDANPPSSHSRDLEWRLGELSAGSDDVIHLTGRWFADLSSNLPIQVAATYRPSNFNADFQAIETAYITTLQSAVTTTIEGPDAAFSGEDVVYEVEILNSSKETIDNVRVELDAPEGFYRTNSDPELDENAPTEWLIEELEPNTPQVLRLTGAYASDQEGFQYIDVRTYIERDSSLLQAEVQTFTDVTGTERSLQMLLNGGMKDASLNPGEDLRVTLSFANRGEQDINDLALLLDFQTEEKMPIIWSEALLNGGTITSDGIVWDGDLFETVEADDKVTIHATFPTYDTFTEDMVDVFPLVASASFGEDEIKSSTFDVSFNSEANFQAEARYFNEDGAPLGSGPLPPTVGRATTYEVSWQLENSIHALEDISITAVLGSDAVWTGAYSEEFGSLEYDASSRTVTWNIERLQTDLTIVSATFDIEITPAMNDVSSFITLLSGASLSATDMHTGATIKKTTSGLTTEIPTDEFAENLGAAIE